MRWMIRLSLCVLLVPMAGCIRFRPVAVPAPAASGWRSVDRALVTTVESRHYDLRNVQVTADSVVGWEQARPTDRRIALHRSEIRRFEQERMDTLWTVVLTLAAVYAAAVYVSLRSMDW